MERVPTELLHRIFIKLELEERIQCMLVCRKWWRVLDECSLLYSVDVTCDKRFFVRFMKMIDQFPHRAIQVEDLYLMDTFPTGFNKRTLLNILPNLRELTMEHDFTENYYSEPIHIKQPISKLRVLYDSTHCEVASQLLSSNLGGKLEQLYLYFKSVQSISTRTLLDQLSNLPVLNRLVLNSLSLGINDVEKIHQNIPSIRVFGLYNITIIDSKMPVTISPATSMTTVNIDIDNADNVKTHSQFYQYMAIKYYNVDSIECNDRQLSNYNDNSIERIYLDGIMDFYKVIAPKQTSFNIHDVPNGVNIPDVFDEMDCRLKELTVTKCQEEILQHLSHSNQSRYIQKLALMWTNVSSIHCIKSMEVLTVLKLQFSDRNLPIVDLADCLNACPPTLKKFTLVCDSMELDISNVHLNYIDTLEISCKSVDCTLADTISSSFPNLVSLTLQGQITENICITLANPSFQKAKFSMPWIKPHGMTFKAPNQVVPQHYTIARSGCSLVPFLHLSQLPVLTVTCFTETRLKFTSWVEILSV